MSLLDDLRAAHATVDPQFLPTANELPGVVGGLALYLEHGDAFLEAAQAGGVAAVADLITGQDQPAAVDAEASDKQAAEDARRATSQQTQVEHEPGGKSSGGKGKK